ncbi:MAG: hypothetical protein ACXVC7_16550, partial [Bacteroidia bacterium]
TTVHNLNLSFDILRVSIDLPWMDGTLFESGAWDWARSTVYPGQLISTGANYQKGEAPTGLMPFVPTAILLARNVELTADWSFDLNDTVNKVSSGGGSIGFGPFRLGGRTNKSDSSTHIIGKANGNTITFGNPQVIGYFVQVLPKSPNRDLSRKWPDQQGLATFSTTINLNKIPTDPLVQEADRLLKLLSQ